MTILLFFIQKLFCYKREFFIGLVLTIALAFFSVALLALSGWFISTSAFFGLFSATAITFNYFIPAAMIRFLALMRILSRYADRVVNHDYTFKILTTLRVWFYQRLMPLSPARLILLRSSDLLNRMVADINTLDHLYLNVLSPLLLSIFLMVCITLFIAHFSDVLALSTIIITVTALSSIIFFTLKNGKIFGQDIQNIQAQLRIKMIDAVQAFSEVLLFQTQNDRNIAIDKTQTTLQTAQKKLSRWKGFIHSLMIFCSSLCVLFVLFLGTPLVENHILNGTIWVMIILLIMAMYEQLLSAPMAALSLGKTQAAAERIWNITHQSPAVIFNDDVSVSKKNYTITLQNISFVYPDETQKIFNDFTYHIPEKIKLGVTGVSGSGKTTLLYLLARIFDVTAGKILIGDTVNTQFSEENLRKTISLVMQFVHIFNASVRDNITLMQKSVSDEKLFAILEAVELADTIYTLPDALNTSMGEFGKNFSGGQIRRIAIARALLCDAPILLLDEPTTGLDHTVIDQIWKNCEEYFKNKTVIVATHEKQLLEKMGSLLQF